MRHMTAKARIIILGTTAMLIFLTVLCLFLARDYEKQLLDGQAAVTPWSFELFERGMELTFADDAAFAVEGIDGSRVYAEGDVFNFRVNVPEDGHYLLNFRYLPLNMAFERNLVNISINGKSDAEMTAVFLPSYFVITDYTSRISKSGAQIYPAQYMLDHWVEHILRVGQNEHRTDPLILPLAKGWNEFEVFIASGSFCLEAAEFSSFVPLPDHATYAAAFPSAWPEALIILEAEHFYHKNDNNISLASSAAIDVSPYDGRHALLNFIDAATFQDNMNRLAYFVEIDEAGFYNIGIKTGMPGKTYAPVFIDIEIDSHIPFAEFHGIELSFNKAQKRHVFREWPVFLSAGIHEIAFVVNGGPYSHFSRQIAEITDGISELSLDLLRLTGNNQDRNREWDLEEFLPDMVDDLGGWQASLVEIEAGLLTLNDDRSNQETQKIRQAAAQLGRLIDEPNSTPYRLSVLSQGPSSAFALLADTYRTLNVQALSLDQIIIEGSGTTEALPEVQRNVAFGLTESLGRLFASYTDDITQSDQDDGQTIDVWIRRPRQYYDMLEIMADSFFTEQTGIHVNLSLAPDEKALTLANAAGKQPDVMINVSAPYVNDLALRGALADLTGFPGVGELAQRAAPGSLLQMTIDRRLYGIPENQDFFIMFYRSDIFESLGMAVPDTWDEVLLLLPQLQRYGMNFATELSISEATKPWTATMPFYALFQADIFSADGMRTTIDSREGLAAMHFMTDLMKIYGMPLQVQSFYNDFRAGRIPIGITGFGTYVNLSFAAPEIAGLWDIAPVPGMYGADGVLERYSSGGGGNGAAVIFEASTKKDAAWEFISWFLSTEVQLEYMTRMQNMYGREFIYPSGNLDALRQLPIPRAHREVIAAQVEWLVEAPRVPGGYSVEREVSNAWNRIIHDDVDVKTAVDEAAVIANREIRRRLEEFGYVDIDGQMLMPYDVPSRDDMKAWARELP